MTDSNNDHAKDSTSSLKTKKTKAKHFTNKDSIYARFLDRTNKLGSTDVDVDDIGIDIDVTTDSVDEYSSYEDPDQRSTQVAQQSVDQTESDSFTPTKVITGLEVEDNVIAQSKAKKKLSKRTGTGSSTASGVSSRADKQVNATKLVFMGILCGVLLAVATILGLYTTGILSNLTVTTDDLDSDLAAKSTPVVTEVATVPTSDVTEPTTESDPNNGVEKGDGQLIKDPSSPTIAPVNDAKNNDAKIKTKVADDATSNTQNIEPKTDISLEEFMQESQSTLYRESSE